MSFNSYYDPSMFNPEDATQPLTPPASAAAVAPSAYFPHRVTVAKPNLDTVTIQLASLNLQHNNPVYPAGVGPRRFQFPPHLVSPPRSPPFLQSVLMMGNPHLRHHQQQLNNRQMPATPLRDSVAPVFAEKVSTLARPKIRHCVFCKNNGESIKFTCPICGATQDFAHTQSYCPQAPKNTPPSVCRFRSRLMSNGKPRRLF